METNSKGYIALSTVLIILVVIIAIVLTTTYTALNEAQSGLALYQGEDNLQGVEGCVEDVMLKIRSSPVVVASVTRPEGTCNISYTASGPTNWDINVTFQSTANTNIQRTVNVNFTRNPTGITLNSWNEI